MKITLTSLIAVNRRALLLLGVLASLMVFGIVSVKIDAQQKQEKIPTNDPPAPSAPDSGRTRDTSMDAPAAVFAANAGTLGLIPDSPAGGNLCGDYTAAPLNVTFTVPPGAVNGPLTDVRVDFTSSAPAHTFVGDLRVTLIAPGGAPSHTIFSQTGSTTAAGCGNGSDISGPYNFFDTAPAAPTWWTTAAVNPVAPGSYRTSTPGGVVGGGANALMTPTFAGLSTAQIAGTWTLRFEDGGQGDTGAISAANLTLTGSAAGNPACLPGTTTGANNTQQAITDLATTTSVITIAGAPTTLTNLRATTLIQHTFPGDLDMTLTSPAGTVVTITSDNGVDQVNAFNGTVWDDFANPFGQVPYANNNGLVTDQLYSPTGGPIARLVPEEPFDAFRGENPNGDWTLRIFDDAAQDVGTLTGWSLNIQAVSTPPTLNPLGAFSNNTPQAIPTTAPPNVITSTINVAGQTGTVEDLDVLTNITHTFNGDLDITVQAPSGRIVTLTTDNGSLNDNGFAGTTFDNDADPGNQVPFPANTFAGSNLVTDTVFVNLVPRTPLTPEESLGAFRGEQPNGIWTLTISDDANGDGGTLNSWGLNMVTNTCAGPSASGVDVAGRVMTPDGYGLRGARVILTDQSGAVLETVTTSAFGFYRFSNVQVGQTYIVNIQSKRFTFTSKLIQVFDSLLDVDFTAEP